MTITRREFISQATLSAAAVLATGSLVGCAAGSVENENAPASTHGNENTDDIAAPQNESVPVPAGETTSDTASSVTQVLATINGTQFVIDLANNETAAAFAAMLPLQTDMVELNGNEKYVYLDESLPTDSSNPGTIQAGDVMLYGNNCLVVFYEAHPTTYSYTRIGKIADTAGLAQTLGPGSVNAEFRVS